MGDELWLNSAPHPPYNHIVGLLGDAGFGALGSGSVVVLDSDYLSEAFDVPPPVRYVDLKVAEGAEDEVLAALDRTMTEPFVVETVADAEQQLGRAQAGFAGLAFLFGLVALAVGAFLVANTLAMTLAERTREVGLLRAAGTTSRQVMGLFLRQGLALGLIGGACRRAAGRGGGGHPDHRPAVEPRAADRRPAVPSGRAAAGVRPRRAGHAGRRPGARPGGLAPVAARRTAAVPAAGPDAGRTPAVGDRAW